VYVKRVPIKDRTFSSHKPDWNSESYLYF
jgi:hypothetical protein